MHWQSRIAETLLKNQRRGSLSYVVTRLWLFLLSSGFDVNNMYFPAKVAFFYVVW